MAQPVDLALDRRRAQIVEIANRQRSLDEGVDGTRQLPARARGDALSERDGAGGYRDTAADQHCSVRFQRFGNARTDRAKS